MRCILKKSFMRFSIIFFIIIKNFHAITIKQLSVDQNYKEYFDRLDKIKIKDKVIFFKYDANFAKSGNLDLKKAIKLPENMHGIGISILKLSNGNEKKFADYDCRIHLVIKNNSDYWLPNDSYGSWYDIRAIGDEITKITGADNVQYWNSRGSDYAMRTFVGSVTHKESYAPIRAGSAIIIKYMKNIFPEMTYLEFAYSCSSFPKIDASPAVWIEKKGGPDFTIERIPYYYKDFYEFPILEEILHKACPYIQKAATYRDWNIIINSSFIKSLDPKDYDLINPQKKYLCNIKNS